MKVFGNNDIVQAMIEDKDELLDFYHSFIGTEGCTWSEEYPNEEIVQADLENKRTYCIKDDKGIVAAISIDDDPLVDNLEVWEYQPSRELARVAVREEYQNQGIGRVLLQYMMDLLKSRGNIGVHFLVSQTNYKAMACYDKLKFYNRGEIFIYHNNWFCYEKDLRG